MLETVMVPLLRLTNCRRSCISTKVRFYLIATLASDDLIAISSQYIKDYSQTSDIVKIGYFSGSISHNENFELIKPAIKQLLTKYSNVQLHIVGILDIPQDMKAL